MDVTPARLGVKLQIVQTHAQQVGHARVDEAGEQLTFGVFFHV